jgi:hypothetical protein
MVLVGAYRCSAFERIDQGDFPISRIVQKTVPIAAGVDQRLCVADRVVDGRRAVAERVDFGESPAVRIVNGRREVVVGVFDPHLLAGRVVQPWSANGVESLSWSRFTNGPCWHAISLRRTAIGGGRRSQCQLGTPVPSTTYGLQAMQPKMWVSPYPLTATETVDHHVRWARRADQSHQPSRAANPQVVFDRRRFVADDGWEADHRFEAP